MEGKYRKPGTAMRCTGAIVLAASVGAASCLGREDRHIEQRQYTPEPTLTTEVWISTATMTIGSPWIIPPIQFE